MVNTLSVYALGLLGAFVGTGINTAMLFAGVSKIAFWVTSSFGLAITFAVLFMLPVVKFTVSDNDVRVRPEVVAHAQQPVQIVIHVQNDHATQAAPCGIHAQCA